MTATAEQAVDTLYKQVGYEPYRTAASWVTTKTFALTDMLQLGLKPFSLDTTLANSNHSNGTGTINRAS
jgi:hypothetical protein